MLFYMISIVKFSWKRVYRRLKEVLSFLNIFYQLINLILVVGQ